MAQSLARSEASRKARPRHCEEPKGDEAIHHLAVQIEIQILPIGISAFNQGDLFLSRAAFNLLLAQDRMFHCAVQLVPNQHLAAVALGEAVNCALLVLPRASGQIGRYASVERPILAVRHEIDGWLEILMHGRWIASPGSSPGSQ